MEGGVKATHLRHLGHQRRQRTHRAQVVWLVQWCEGDEAVELAQHAGVQAGGRTVAFAAMDDTVAGGGNV